MAAEISSSGSDLTPAPDNVGLLPSTPAGRITIRRVLAVTARYHGVTVPELLTRGRKRRLVRRRQVAAYVARRTSGRGMTYIAGRMGGWHHTTILHSVRVVKSRLDAGDATTVAAVNAIVAQVEGGARG
jgi:chromosomal replication initiation ATPase DnaA